jgi:hypothetical protein
MKAKPLPPIEVLRTYFTYDSETGIIYRKNKHRGKAGYTTSRGRTLISFSYGGRVYTLQASRLAWALWYGEDPGDIEVDHKNRKPYDNSITNLRLATRKTNNENRNIDKVRTPIKITYPDGRGTIVVDSCKTAAKILNRSRCGVGYILRHGGEVYYGMGGSRVPSGIRLERVSEQ